MIHEQIRLSNGLDTLFINCPGHTAASVQIWFRAGSALEEKKDHGIAHFLEHMFFRGTDKRPGAQIAHDVESYGGEINAFTSFDYTCYYINSPASKLETTIEILLDMVSNPRFLEEDIVPERGVVFEEYRRSLDSPGQYSFHRLQQQSFSGNYGHSILGNEKTIKNFSQQQLIDFRKKHYNLNNALLVVAGDMSNRKKIEEIISQFKLPSGPVSKLPKLNIKKTPTIDVFTKDVRMAQLTIVLQASDFVQPNATSEDLAMNCLGHGETSRLHQALVIEGQIANGCAASTLFMNRGGAHLIRLSFPVKNTKKVLDKFTKTISEIIKTGMTKDEVKKIKQQYIASKVYDLESVEARAFSLGHGFAQNNDVNAEDEFISRMKHVTTSEVNSALEEIFSRTSHLNLQLPKGEDVKKFKQQLEGFHKKLTNLTQKKSASAAQKYNALKVETSKYDKQVKLIELKKGIKLLYRKNPMAPTFVLHSYMKGGLSEESSSNNGIYHLLCALLTKGHKKLKYEKLQSILEERSASFSGFSGKNAYGLTMHGQSENFGELSEIFLQSFISPALPAKFLKHEKEMTLRSLENIKEDPIRNCFQTASSYFFNKHPYSRPVLGSEKNVRSISRKAIEELHLKNLKNKEILLTYCGDLELEEVIDTLRPHLDTLKTRNSKKTKFHKYTPKQTDHTHLSFDREQTHIFIGIPCGPLTHKDNLYLKMLTSHLSGQSSELFVDVRDKKGLCYSAQPVHMMALEGGYWGIYMGSGHDKVEPAKAAIFDIIEKIKKNGLSKSEFNRIKDMIEGQSLINVQTNEDYASIYSVPALHGQGLDFYHQSNKNVRELKHEEFQKEIKKILGRKWSTITVGRD